MSKKGESPATTATKELSDADIDRILGELMRIQERDDECELAQYSSLISANQYRFLYQIVRRHVPVGATVLDWGCGNGHFSYALLRLGYEACGFELGDFCLRGRLGKGYEFRQANARNPNLLPYPSNKFDAVVSVGVLEHVRSDTGGNEEASLQEIFRVLKPGGCFVCYHFPNYFSYIEVLNALVPRKYGHPHRYTKRSIEALSTQTGIELVEVRRYGFLPRNTWNRFPRIIRHSKLAASAYNFLDQIMGYPFFPICQNYAFVARKPSA